MRVLQILTQMEAGGAQRIAILTARELRNKGHEVKTCFLFRRRGTYDDEPDTFCLYPHDPKSIFCYLRILCRLFRKILEYHPDGVLTFAHYSNVIGCTFAWLCGVKTRVARQTTLPSKTPVIPRFIDKIIGSLGVYSVITSGSQVVLDAYTNYPEAYRKHLKIVSSAVEIVPPQQDVSSIRQKYDIPNDQFVVLTVGRLTEGKNYPRLIQAMKSLDNVFLVIVGDGEDRNAVDSLITDENLSTRISMIGDVAPEHLGDIYNAADAFVFPSLWETFGMTPLEAAGSGLPLAVGDIPAMNEVIGEDNAIFFNPYESKEIASAILSLQKNPELCADLSIRSRKVAERFSVTEMGKSFETCLLGEAQDG